MPAAPPTTGQRVSRCAVCLRQRGQNFCSSSRSGSFRRFSSVWYVRSLQSGQASVTNSRSAFFAIVLLPREPDLRGGGRSLGPQVRCLLLVDLGDDARADRSATLAIRDPEAVLDGHGGNQLDLH